MRKHRRSSSRFTPLLRLFLIVIFLLSLGVGMSLYDFNYAFNHIFVNGVTSEAQIADPDTPLVIVAPTEMVAAPPTPTEVQRVAIATASLLPTVTRQTTSTRTPCPTRFPSLTPLPTSTPSYSYTYTGSDRITLLLLGVDQRITDPIDTTRSDTMILLTFDPATNTAGMLSIPRDLYVDIPGAGLNKINVAHAIGGPYLAKKTVANLLGVRVNYYLRVNFRGFVQIVDALGGVTLDVERPLRDEMYPVGDTNEVRRLYIDEGLQHMDGTQALMYARTRHQNSDFDRLKRQQDIIFALRSQAISTNALQHYPELLHLLGDTVQTDVPLKDLPGLLATLQGIPRDAITARAIDASMVYPAQYTVAGDILIPNMPAIRDVVREVYRVRQATR